MCRARRTNESGLTAVEIVTTCALFVTVSALAIPLSLAAVDEYRTASAARYLASRCRLARMQAVRRSAAVALTFERIGSGIRFASFVDGNGNGVRASDIARGIDQRLTTFERIEDQFAGVAFGLHGTVPAIGAGVGGGDRNALQIGRSGILTFTPSGTATSGTLYVRGRRTAQYAVRVLGATGRTRVLSFHHGSRQWIER